MRLFEINTLPWLAELSERYEREVNLATVPSEEWDALTPYHFDAVWLMGVWQRSPTGQRIAETHDGVLKSCVQSLPGFNRSRDVVGSPYCIRAYEVDARLGGGEGLAIARGELRKRNLGLFLDFVPNHTARDHSWLASHPEYYVQAAGTDLRQNPQRFFESSGRVLAFGNGEWTDSAQLDAFSRGYRAAAVETLTKISELCDGVRCDMAFLLRTDTFHSKWGAWAQAKPADEFWTEVIPQVKARHRDFIFIAESYEHSEWNLLHEGFDYCYDKDKLYDRLKAGNPELVRQHLQGCSRSFLQRLVHFIENHDEQPAASVFVPKERECQAAVAIATLPGPSLWHYMQFEGRWGKQVLQLGASVSVRRFYRRLLQVTNRPAIREGTWTWAPVSGCPSLLAWCWEASGDRVLVVLNMAESPTGHKAWGNVAVPLPTLKGRKWRLRDLLSGEEWVRHGDEMFAGRLQVGLPAWGSNLFELMPA